ncbi:hypothetical protein [Aquirufa sp. OSTEICH-129A]
MHTKLFKLHTDNYLSSILEQSRYFSADINKNEALLIIFLSILFLFYLLVYKPYSDKKQGSKIMPLIYLGIPFILSISLLAIDQDRTLLIKSIKKSEINNLELLDCARLTIGHDNNMENEGAISILFDLDKLVNENMDIESINYELTNIFISINDEFQIIIPSITIDSSIIRNGLFVKINDDFKNKRHVTFNTQMEKISKIKFVCDQGILEFNSSDSSKAFIFP